MYPQIVQWLTAPAVSLPGTPPHWMVVATVLYALAEAAMKKSARLANSPVEGLANLLGMIPGVRALAAPWMTPNVTTTTATVTVASSQPKQGGFIVMPLVLPIVIVAAVVACMSGCASAYDSLHVAASTADTVLAGFRSYDAAHKRDILAAHPECKTTVAEDLCYRNALAPYQAKRDPVLAKIDVLEPTIAAAVKVAKQANADRNVTGALLVRLTTLAADVTEAIDRLKASEQPHADGGVQ